LVVEREGGRINWYHRQLKQTAEERYSKNLPEIIVLYAIMAKYFSSSFFDSKFYERSSMITPQPLLLNYDAEYVWLLSAIVNERFYYKYYL